MKVRIDRIVVHGVAAAPDRGALEAAVRSEVAAALRDVTAPPRSVRLLRAAAPHGTEPGRAIAAAVRSAFGGTP